MPDEDHGKILAAWQFDEYTQHNRSIWWYIGGSLISIAILTYSVWQKNFLFSVFIVLVLIVLILRHGSEPVSVEFKIMEDGIIIGSGFYKFKEIETFWIVYDPPSVKNLYFNFKSRIHPHVMIPLKNQNPINIRRLLNRVIKEDFSKEDEALSEFLGKHFKI